MDLQVDPKTAAMLAQARGCSATFRQRKAIRMDEDIRNEVMHSHSLSGDSG